MVTVDVPPRSDRITAVVLLVCLGLLAPVMSIAGVLLFMVSDSCGSSTVCSSGQIVVGVGVAAAAPWIALVAGVVLVVKRVRRQRRAWWIPLVAALAGAVLFVVGAAIAFTAVH